MTNIPCKVCNSTRYKYYGIAVSSLTQLRTKGSETLGFNRDSSVSVVLEVDGTVVEDEAYFLCMPSNTKFMLLHENETWTPAKKSGAGTALLRDVPLDVVMDTVDSGGEAWCSLAVQLKEDLASIILMSEADLQCLVDAPLADLTSALGFSEKKTQDLQDTLQRVLDRREEERQSKELLQLYLKVVEKEQGQAPQPEGKIALDVADGMEVDSASSFSSRTLQVLKSKTSPETRLSNEELQMVLKEGVQSLMKMLGWAKKRTTALLQDCEKELNKRLQRIQTLESLSAQSQRKKQSCAESDKEKTQTKRRK